MVSSFVQIQSDWIPLGYEALVRRFGIRAMPHHCRSFIGGTRKTFVEEGRIVEIYTKRYSVQEETPGEQLEFALKYEGINLEILAAVFKRIEAAELITFIQRTPKGKSARRIRDLYEFLTGDRLDIEDLTDFTRYDLLLDEKQYFTAPYRSSPRHKIRDNMLGNLQFCPIVRRTSRIEGFIEARFDDRSRAVLMNYPDEMRRRAIDYLFIKETKSSFAIERLEPDQKRSARFVESLKRSSMEEFLHKDILIALQRAIVEERYAVEDYRTDQNYVGVSLRNGHENVHYVSPKPQDVPSLMEGLLQCALQLQTSLLAHTPSRTIATNTHNGQKHDLEHQIQFLQQTLEHAKNFEQVGKSSEAGIVAETANRLMDQNSKQDLIHPVVVAGAIAFGFVFIHPFEDGNGRIHRFLIHHILAFSSFTPEGAIFPVSATMLHRRPKYDALLESFSKPLLSLIDYEMDREGRMSVKNDTALHYRYPDMTRFVEELFEFIQETVETELPAELDYLVNHDRAWKGLQEIVDMPDQLINLFILSSMENHGHLSKTKRASHFSKLTDEEILRMEQCVREAFGMTA